MLDANALPRYRFTVFMNGHEANSTTALRNLEELCRSVQLESYAIETVDVTQDIDKALKAGIVVTPTVVLTTPQTTVTLFGTLQDTVRLLDAIGVKERVDGST